MIPKNLKVGDTFKDGRFTYRVKNVLDNGMYESEMVEDIKELKFTEVKEKVVIKEEMVDYRSMPYAQLKKMCAEKGLDATGSKVDLVARLEG